MVAYFYAEDMTEVSRSGVYPREMSVCYLGVESRPSSRGGLSDHSIREDVVDRVFVVSDMWDNRMSGFVETVASVPGTLKLVSRTMVVGGTASVDPNHEMMVLGLLLKQISTCYFPLC